MLAALTLFGVSFGYVEAAVVVYLRSLYEPLHQRLHPGRDPGDLFPLVRLDQLQSAEPEYMRLLAVEHVRELATLAMLAAIALAIARNFRQWSAGFVIVFGVWDLFYYVFLKMLIDWPASLLTWDLLFLVPVPWAGPVLAPILVSVAMIAAGTAVLRRESLGRPVFMRWPHWAVVALGGLVLVAAFCEDFANTMAGGAPSPFNWTLFALGQVVGLSAVAHALWAGSPNKKPRSSADAVSGSGSISG